MLFQHKVYHFYSSSLARRFSPLLLIRTELSKNAQLDLVLPRKAVIYIWYIFSISLVPQIRIDLVRVTASMSSNDYFQTKRPGGIKTKIGHGIVTNREEKDGSFGGGYVRFLALLSPPPQKLEQGYT